MDNIIFNGLVQLGAVGILVSVLVWLVVRYEHRMGEIYANHRDERDEWRKQAREQHAEVTSLVQSVTAILVEIKTMVAGRKG